MIQLEIAMNVQRGARIMERAIRSTFCSLCKYAGELAVRGIKRTVFTRSYGEEAFGDGLQDICGAVDAF